MSKEEMKELSWDLTNFRKKYILVNEIYKVEKQNDGTFKSFRRANHYYVKSVKKDGLYLEALDSDNKDEKRSHMWFRLLLSDDKITFFDPTVEKCR